MSDNKTLAEKLQEVFTYVDPESYSNGDRELRELTRVLRESGWLRLFSVSSEADYIFGDRPGIEVRYGMDFSKQENLTTYASLFVIYRKIGDEIEVELSAGIYSQNHLGEEKAVSDFTSFKCLLSEGNDALDEKLFKPAFEELVQAMLHLSARVSCLAFNALYPLRDVFSHSVLPSSHAQKLFV